MQQRLVMGGKFVKCKIEKNVESKRYCTYKRTCESIRQKEHKKHEYQLVK